MVNQILLWLYFLPSSLSFQRLPSFANLGNIKLIWAIKDFPIFQYFGVVSEGESFSEQKSRMHENPQQPQG